MHQETAQQQSEHRHGDTEGHRVYDRAKQTRPTVSGMLMGPGVLTGGVMTLLLWRWASKSSVILRYVLCWQQAEKCTRIR